MPTRALAFWGSVTVLATMLAVGLATAFRARSCAAARAGDARLDEIVAILYRQAARWAVASEQDASPIIAVLHANYGAGYLWALKDIATPEEFARATGGADFLEFERDVVRIQDAAARKLVKACETVAPVSSEALAKAMYYGGPMPKMPRAIP